MTDTRTSRLSQRNKQAWDRLYARTPEPVWGRDPVGFLPRFLDGLGPLGPDEAVLDAAAGEGRNLPLLGRLGGRLHACDASAEALRKIERDATTGVELIVTDLRSLAYPDGRFTFILLSDVIETLPDVDAVLDEVVRVLAPRGRLLCNIPGFDDGVAGEEMQPIGEGRYLYRNEFFYRFFTPTAARRLLRSHGLDIEREEVCRWTEPPHPAFRNHEHEHVSTVFLARRAT